MSEPTGNPQRTRGRDIVPRLGIVGVVFVLGLVITGGTLAISLAAGVSAPSSPT